MVWVLLLEQNPCATQRRGKNQSFSKAYISVQIFLAFQSGAGFSNHQLKVGSRANEGSTPWWCKRGLFLLGFQVAEKHVRKYPKMHPFFHSHVGLLQLQAIVESFCKACCNYWIYLFFVLFHGFYQFKLIKTKSRLWRVSETSPFFRPFVSKVSRAFNGYLPSCMVI